MPSTREDEKFFSAIDENISSLLRFIEAPKSYMPITREDEQLIFSAKIRIYFLC